MKCILTLDVKTDNSLTVKRPTLVPPVVRLAPTQNENIKKEEQASSDHVTIRATDDLEVEVTPTKALETLENEKGF